MKTSSKKAKLSRFYTNHCIWKTVVTNLNDKGFEAHDIMAMTGHKSESSIKSYASRCPDSKCCKMCDALAENYIEPKNSKKTATLSVPPLDFTDMNVMNVWWMFNDLEIPENQIWTYLLKSKKRMNVPFLKQLKTKKKNPKRMKILATNMFWMFPMFLT